MRTKARDYGPVTIERVERALAILAYIMSLEDGSRYAPLFESLEQAREELLRERDTVSRAKRLLESYGGRPRLALPPPDDEDRCSQRRPSA